MNELWTIIHNKMKRVNQSYIRTSREGGRVGCRCSHKLALPRHRAIATRPKSCLDVRDGSEVPDLCPTARPMARMVEMVSSERPPRVSMTKGTNSSPTERQAERLETSLRRTPTWRAWPGVDAASARVCCWRGEITWTSTAAGRPRFQLGSRISAGLTEESGTRLGASFEGARAADWSALKTT